MKKKIILTVFTLFGLSTIALAGPAPSDIFNDLVDPNEDYKYVDNWYSEAAHYFKGINVIQGIDGNFVPEKSVSRAELAVILKRYHDYMNNPKGIEWEEKRNDYYSVSYPKDQEGIYANNERVTMEECGSGIMGRGDFALFIKCTDAQEVSVQEILDEFLSEGNSMSYSEFILNGYKAWKVTNIFKDDFNNSMATELIIVDGKDKIYEIGYGTLLNDRGFETFYRSFKPLK